MLDGLRVAWSKAWMEQVKRSVLDGARVGWQGMKREFRPSNVDKVLSKNLV